jgi:TonB-linked SusC/RagA family outer membrane protein
MRRFVTKIAVLLLLFSPLLTHAQTSITGKITDEKTGNGIPNVSVLVKGKKTGTKTDNNGNFTIDAVKGDILTISSVGFESQRIKVDGNTIALNLTPLQTELGEVVVTAMDIKRAPRELGFSASNVGGKEVTESQRDNLLNALQGRVAGATVTPTGGMAGASSSIVLRGFNSLALSNQPLFIVDGVVVDNGTFDETSNQGTGIGLASDRPNRTNDYTNRIGDLNPNDIESYTILKGPEATALYGSQASSGAIIIVTKKTRTNPAKKVTINYDVTFRFQELTRLPEVQNVYQPGRNAVLEDRPLLDNYFGPRYPANTRTFDNINNFFQTGFNHTHNLSIEFGNKELTHRASFSYLNTKGVVPTNIYRRINFRYSATWKPSKLIDFTPSITLTDSKNDRPLRGAGGYMLTLLSWPSNDDIREFADAAGNKLTNFPVTDPVNEIDNPFFNIQSNRSQDLNKRQIGTLAVNIHPTKWLDIAGRFGIDHYNNDGWTFYHPQSNYTTIAQRGAQDNYYITYNGYNHTITTTARKKLGDFNGRLMVGTMWQDYRKEGLAVYGTNVIDVKRRDTLNTLPNTRRRLFRQQLFGQPNYTLSRQFAYFGEVALSWKNAIFLNATYRTESSSNLPKINRVFSYPGGSLSIIFTDLVPGLKNSKFITYGKLRGSLAATARANAPYSNQSTLSLATSSGGGFFYGFNNNNFFLEPEKQRTYEFGTELRFWQNRITLDATYYNTENKDQIVELFRASYGTGFVLNTLNAASTNNQGVEISLGITPIKKGNLTWTTTFNFNRMWNKVLSLPGNVPEFYNSDTWLYSNARGGLVQGNPSTTITAWNYLRNNEGKLLINPATGLPISDNTFSIAGDRNPDFTLGINNSVRLKNWRFGMLWNAKVGGDIFNGTEMFLTLNGKSTRTLDRETPRIIEGVLRDGLENTANPTKNTISVLPYLNNDFYKSMNPVDFIEKDINWLRMSEISATYTFPLKRLKSLDHVASLSIFATINDLILITNYSGADPQVNGNTSATRGVGAFGFDYGNIATPVSYNFGVRVGF